MQARHSAGPPVVVVLVCKMLFANARFQACPSCTIEYLRDQSKPFLLRQLEIAASEESSSYVANSLSTADHLAASEIHRTLRLAGGVVTTHSILSSLSEGCIADASSN